MKLLSAGLSRWQRFVARVATLTVASLTVLSFSGCGGGSSSSAAPVAAPGAPTALTATGGENVATLNWTAPTSGGAPATFEIYSSSSVSTATALVAPAYRIGSVAVVAGQTTYSFTAVGLAGANTTHYFVVTAKNAGGETASAVANASVTGPRTPQTYGNNFSAALIFADDIGITNVALDPAKSWAAGIADVTAIDYNTGLRPLPAEVTAMLAVPQTTLPYLPVASKIDPAYYEQKSINTWQGEWARGAATPQDVNAKWGDNLVSASLSAGSKIRIEMVLSKDVTATPMTSYPMLLLSGSGTSELQGTTGVPNPATTTAFVFATNARLQLQKLDASGVPTGPMITDQALFDPAIPDGLNKLSGEIPVSGNFTYGFVWDPSTSGSTAGKYRVTFKLDPTSAFGTGTPANNTFMKTATNGVRVSDTEVYIDIDVK